MFIFVTGTDTGVGKTVFTALLLHHLIEEGVNVVGLKPFCSGNRKDASTLASVQKGHLSLDEINAFHFAYPVTPLLAARNVGQAITARAALARLRPWSKQADAIVVEGAGGLLSPLGEGLSSLDLIKALRCAVVLVAPNRLGVINHVRLNLEVLHRHRVRPPAVVLMGVKEPDQSVARNADILRELASEMPVHTIPHLGRQPVAKTALKKNYLKVKKTLAEVMGHLYFPPRS